MGPPRHQVATEEQDAEKGQFEEKSGQAFIGKQWRQNVGGGIGKAAPVRAELKRHHDARNDPHAESDGEDLGQKIRYAKIDRAAGGKMDALKNGNVGSEPDGQRRKQDVPGNHPGELKARHDDRIKCHAEILSKLHLPPGCG